MTITTGLLIDYPEALTPLVDLFETQWADWYNAQGASARADLSERARRNGLPLGLVALVDGEVAGTCALTASSGGLVTERSPWLGGLVVLPQYRRRGAGRALLDRARSEARRLGYGRLHALTESATALFEQAGWSRQEAVQINGVPHAIFTVIT